MFLTKRNMASQTASANSFGFVRTPLVAPKGSLRSSGGHQDDGRLLVGGLSFRPSPNKDGVLASGQGGRSAAATASGNGIAAPVQQAEATAFLPKNQKIQGSQNNTGGRQSQAPSQSKVGDGALEKASPSSADTNMIKESLKEISQLQSRVDALCVRVGSQDSALKNVERSLASLRQEYSTISQSTGGQSITRVENLERQVARFEAAFQEFSNSVTQKMQDIEDRKVEDRNDDKLIELATPFQVTTLRPQLNVEEMQTVWLHLPMFQKDDGSIAMTRRSLDEQGGVLSEDFIIQSPEGTPLVSLVS